MATVINHNLPVKQANILVKKAIASKFAVLNEKDNVLKVGAPMMTATIKITDKTIEIDNNGPAGKIVANTCASAIQMEIDQLESAPQPEAQAQPQASAVSDMDEKLKAAQLLKSYKDLLDVGVLTQEEFDDKKEELLEKLNGGSSENDGKPKKREIYKEALAAKNNGDYEKAIELFESTNGYSDSEQQVIQCDELLNKKNYDNAVSIKNSGDYAMAIEEFRKLNGYADSNEQIAECDELSAKRDYDYAVSLKNSGEYEKAISEFTKLNGYADSEQQIKETGEMQTESIYQNALNRMNSKNYDDAIRIFTNIKDYKDSQTQIEKCRNAIDLENKESVYNSCITNVSEIRSDEEFTKINELTLKLRTLNDYDRALVLIDKYNAMVEAYKETRYSGAIASFEEEKYQEAINAFAFLRDYKDSSARLEQAKSAFHVYSEYKSAVSVDNCKNIKMYQYAISQLKSIGDYKDSKDYIQKYENAVKALKKKTTKIAVIGGSSAAAAVLVLVLTLTVFVPLGRLKKIPSLIDSGDYASASELIDKNGNFGDTQKLELMRKAGESFEKKDYESGISYVTSAGGSVDVSYNANGGDASKTSETIRNRRGARVNNDPTPETGYKFTRWEQTDYSIQSKEFKASVSLSAIYTPITYTISYDLVGGSVSGTNPTTYTIEDSIDLNPAYKTGCTFTGWRTESGDIINSIKKGTYGTLKLTAVYSVNTYTLSVSSEDEAKGGVTGSGTYEYDSQVTVTAIPNDGCVFKGWYHESAKVSDDASYTFTMPANDYSLIAHFLTKEEEYAQKYATRPNASDDGKTITYGLYPQTNVNDSSLISTLNALTTPDSNGWYLYDDDYYAKVSATPYGGSYKFNNGTIIVSGRTYWFKCEPIVWNVLNNDGGVYYILSSALLDAHCYYNSSSSRTIDGQTIYANNYEYSDIRAWLNEDFYNSAFALGNEYIQTTTVDNSAATTNTTSNSYACANTKDKVFLPSHQDYTNSSYGFSSDVSRHCKTTDYARARGAYYYSSGSYQYNCYYWTRSPSSYYSSNAWYVHYSGSLSYGSVNSTNGCVRPSLSIKIA